MARTPSAQQDHAKWCKRKGLKKISSSFCCGPGQEASSTFQACRAENPFPGATQALLNHRAQETPMCNTGRPRRPGTGNSPAALSGRSDGDAHRGPQPSSSLSLGQHCTPGIAPRGCPSKSFTQKSTSEVTHVPADRLLTPGKTGKLIPGCCTQTTGIFCGDALPSVRFDAGLALKHLHRQTSRAAAKPGEMKVLAGEKQRADGHQASPVPSGSRRGGHPLGMGARNVRTRLAFAF